ncbi:hypothetical protein EJ02DRAFT_363347 [Clathrospora elynae]|uniref:Uncharacterized protein n=1 Tax=Clathrospora elynae TaxID=706981 RepID=A0A6A5S1S5_9PLEO|nr:hypothetical protein EJ02DRAFT_363347 [Clathrospora elynae]
MLLGTAVQWRGDNCNDRGRWCNSTSLCRHYPFKSIAPCKRAHFIVGQAGIVNLQNSVLTAICVLLTATTIPLTIILKKPGKPDYSAPKAYRVIALLSCLGKVIERLLAKRLSALAEVSILLYPSQIR